MISLRAHNIADYVFGAILLMTPFAFGFSEVAFALDVFLMLGIAVIGYSLITDYFYSLAKIIPRGVHMTFDVITGIFLILAPNIYGYRFDITGFQQAIHFVYGIGLIALVMLTRKTAEPAAVQTPKKEDEKRAA